MSTLTRRRHWLSMAVAGRPRSFLKIGGLQRSLYDFSEVSALKACHLDLEAAVDLLRKKGAASAAKKADREAKEGVIAQAIVHNGRVGVLAEVNCETDFVAKNDAFRSMADAVAHKFAENDAAEVEADRVEAVQKLGENIQVRRHARLEVQGNGGVAAYIHTGGKVGVLVEVGAEKDATAQTEEFKQLVRDITLQIAAASPVCVSRACAARRSTRSTRARPRSPTTSSTARSRSGR